MSSFEKVKGGKLRFKGGDGPVATEKRKKRKKPKQQVDDDAREGGAAGDASGKDGGDVNEIDDGTGYAPTGSKKTKKYEELFPFETVRFGYVASTEVKTREDALDERSKRKADRYCK